jgi:hypothetical protein
VEERFIREVFGIDKENLREGLVFRKRKDWVRTLREQEERLRRIIDRRSGSKLAEAGYATWKMLKEKTGTINTTPSDVVASAEKLEEIMKLVPESWDQDAMKKIALHYGAIRDVRETLEKAGDKDILWWILREKGKFLDYVAPIVILEAKKRGLDPHRTAELLVKAIKEGEV